MSKLVLQDIGSGYNLQTVVNNNNAFLEEAFNNTLSRDGTTPNEMEANLDMNSHQVINLASPTSDTSAARWVDVTNATDVQGIAAPSLVGNDGKYLRAGVATVVWDTPSITYQITSAESSAGAVITNPEYEPGNVKRYGAVGDGSTDDTAAVQMAIDVGGTVYFPDGTYACNNLTQDTNFQYLYGTGMSFIKKNGNGDLFNSTGSWITLELLDFRGESATPAFAGNNVVLTGEAPTLINCASMWAVGRALKATGNRVRVLGSRGVYQTSTSAGYDIEIGTPGTSTLYHVLTDFNTSQPGGGILFIDSGSHFLHNVQFGKLYVQRNTAPAGSNGGVTSNCRILGNVDVELSSAVFTGCQFSNITVTFAATTSGCSLDDSNTFASGATVVNNGNANNLIVQQTSTGGTCNLRYGGTASNAEVQIDPVNGTFEYSRDVYLKNTRALRLRGTSGSDGQVSVTAANNLAVTNNNSAASTQIAQVGNGSIQMFVNGQEVTRLDGTVGVGSTRLMIYDVDNATLERVSVGTADSGGTGYKVLRIPN